jgi:hypothetical protein
MNSIACPPPCAPVANLTQVIALEVRPQSGVALVWDIDLQHPRLPFPCSLQQYAQHALQAHSIKLPQQYQRWAKLIHSVFFERTLFFVAENRHDPAAAPVSSLGQTHI